MGDESLLHQRPVELEDVLGAQVSVGDDPLRRWSWAGGVQQADEIPGSVQVIEPRVRVGVLGRDEVCDRRRIDGVQLAEEPSEPSCGALGWNRPSSGCPGIRW